MTQVGCSAWSHPHQLGDFGQITDVTDNSVLLFVWGENHRKDNDRAEQSRAGTGLIHRPNRSTRSHGAHEGSNCAEKGKSPLAGTVTLDLRVRTVFCLVVKTEHGFDKWGKGKVVPGKERDVWKEQR